MLNVLIKNKNMATKTNYKFTVHVRESASISDFTKSMFKVQYYMVLVGRNGQDIAVGETRKSKSGLVKTINNLFPGVKIKMP